MWKKGKKRGKGRNEVDMKVWNMKAETRNKERRAGVKGKKWGCLSAVAVAVGEWLLWWLWGI